MEKLFSYSYLFKSDERFNVEIFNAKQDKKCKIVINVNSVTTNVYKKHNSMSNHKVVKLLLAVKNSLNMSEDFISVVICLMDCCVSLFTSKL